MTDHKKEKTDSRMFFYKRLDGCLLVTSDGWIQEADFQRLKFGTTIVAPINGFNGDVNSIGFPGDITPDGQKIGKRQVVFYPNGSEVWRQTDYEEEWELEVMPRKWWVSGILSKSDIAELRKLWLESFGLYS